MNRSASVLIFLLSVCLGCISPLQAGINDGLVGHYPFNGDANDYNGTNNGILVGSAIFDNGINGLAFDVSGDADYATIPADTNINFNFTAKTISVWLYAGTQIHSQVEVLDKTDSSDYDLALLTNAAPGLIELRFRAFDASGSHAISGLVPLKQWINAVVVKNGTNISFYTNANLAGITTVGSVTTKSNALFVGAGGSPYQAGYGFTGLIEDLRFFNRALAPDEILGLYTWSYPTLSLAESAAPAGFQISWNASSGQTYQLQCNTNLFSTNWTNLGAPLLATNGVISVSGTNAPSASQQFYRVLLLQ